MHLNEGKLVNSLSYYLLNTQELLNLLTQELEVERLLLTPKDWLNSIFDTEWQDAESGIEANSSQGQSFFYIDGSRKYIAYFDLPHGRYYLAYIDNYNDCIESIYVFLRGRC